VNAAVSSAPQYSIISKLVQEDGLTDQQFPWYLGFVNPQEVTGNVVSYSDFINYSQVDRESLVKLLASGLLAGRGPNSLYIKARESGLAYGFLMRSDPGRGLILYYADRSQDVPSLMGVMNSIAKRIPEIQDPRFLDYALRQPFSIPRSIYTFSIRGRLLAEDMRDGNTPQKVRRFSEAVLKLRHDPRLFSELTRAGLSSICGILLEPQCKDRQKAAHSIFFFVGSEKILSDAEKRLPVPKLLRLWPSDYWLQ